MQGSQISTTSSRKNSRGITMRNKAVLLIITMLLSSVAPFSTSNLGLEANSDETSSRTGDVEYIQYFGNWTGQNALVNQTAITPISPMTIPLTAVADTFGITNDDLQYTELPQNWWTMNTPVYTDIGTQTDGTLELNGGTQWSPNGKMYGGVALDGSPGSNITSTNCAPHTAFENNGNGFAGWIKPNSLGGQLFSRTVDHTFSSSHGGFDGVDVSINASGWLQMKVFWAAQNEFDTTVDWVFDESLSMTTRIEVGVWNYVAVRYYRSSWNFYGQVYVDNGTTDHKSNGNHGTYFDFSHATPSHHSMLTYGNEPCVFGEEFDGEIDELRYFKGSNPMGTNKATDLWKTDGPTPLPSGLFFDYQTGEITGTPSTPWPSTDYTVTVVSGEHNASTVLALEVVEPDLPSISHGTNDAFFLTTGDEESISPPSNLGGDSAFWTLTAGHPTYSGQVDISPSSTCALDDEGKLYCWGENLGKMLDSSQGTNYVVHNPTLHPDAAAANLTFTKIASEPSGFCGILTNGSLWCWGDDDNTGRLGLGQYNHYQSPQQVLFDPELNPFVSAYWTGPTSSQGCSDISPSSGYGFESFENTSAVAWEEHLVGANGNPTGSDGNWSYTNTNVHGNLNTLHGNYVLGSASSNLDWDSQASHTITQHETSIIELNITTGTGVLSFCSLWSSNYNDVVVELDGTQIEHWSNVYTSMNWKSISFPVTSGNHLLTIEYYHDHYSNSFFDRAFIDALKWPLPSPPVNWTEPTVTDIAWNDNTACAIADSDVYCWGANEYGILGNGDLTSRNRPAKVSTPANLSFSAVDVGSYHACALADDGTMWCWGEGIDGRLGHSADTWNPEGAGYSSTQSWFSTARSYLPVQVDFNANVTVSSIELGIRNTCAIATDDDNGNEQLWCWGYNNNYQSSHIAGDVAITLGPLYESASTGSIPTHVETDQTQTCVLFSNASVWCMGKHWIGTNTNNDWEHLQDWWELDGYGQNVTSLSAGGSSTYGMCVMVQHDPALYCWGNNENNQQGVTGLSTGLYKLPGPVDGLIGGRDNAVLAPGLTFNNSNGMITGTPTTENTDPVELNIYSCNGRGCDSASFNYSIWDRPETSQVDLTGQDVDDSKHPPEVHKGRNVNLSIEVTSERPIANYTWWIEHTNGLFYYNMFPNSPTFVTDQLPLGLQVLHFSATDDIGGTSNEAWVILNVLESDSDGDQVPFWNDLCPEENALGYDVYIGIGSSQQGSDGCIDNSDTDQFLDPDDACPTEFAAPEWDLYIGESTDVLGSDGCIDDTDRDTILENVDQCLTTPFAERFYVNPQGCGPSERDTDGDGYKDNVDACENTPLGESTDEFGCGESQVDSDGDGVYDNNDVCPESPLGATVDIDGCAAAEKDGDGDGVNDEVDVCDTTPPGSEVNLVGCAEGDLVTDDNDQDGVADIFDNCPMTPVGDVVDYGGCGLTQKDTDNDGITDAMDQCQDTPGYDIPTIDGNGCGSTQRDSDSDGVIDSVDQCLNTPSSVEVTPLGCQAGLSDTDLDSIADLIDACPNTTGDQPVNLNGCAPYQLDSDGDGITNDLDVCPTTPAGQPIKPSGCAIDPDVNDPIAEDDDFDGVNNDYDECPDTPLGTKVIDNRGCPVHMENSTESVSTIALGIMAFAILFLLLLTVLVMRGRSRRESALWDSGAAGDVLFDAIDTDGDGEISDEEWEVYKKYRDSKQSSSEIEDDDLFD